MVKARRAITICLGAMGVVCLCLTAGPTMAAAKSGVMLRFGSVSTASGAVASVPVTASWAGLAGEPSTLVLHAAWDADWITLSGVSPGPALSGSGKQFDFEPHGKSVVILVYGGQSALPQAELVHLNFQVSPSAKVGASTVVRDTATTASDAAGNAISLSVADGAVTVTQGPKPHSADYNQDWSISLSEVLRMVQLHNVGSFHCDASTEDGYAAGPGDQSCTPHDSDYIPSDWAISLSELMRIIQFYNAPNGSYHLQSGTEDGYAPGVAP